MQAKKQAENPLPRIAYSAVGLYNEPIFAKMGKMGDSAMAILARFISYDGAVALSESAVKIRKREADVSRTIPISSVSSIRLYAPTEEEEGCMWIAMEGEPPGESNTVYFNDGQYDEAIQFRDAFESLVPGGQRGPVRGERAPSSGQERLGRVLLIMVLVMGAIVIATLAALLLTGRGGNDRADAGTDEPYAITYQRARTWTDSAGALWAQTIVEIANTGAEELYLAPGAYDLLDSAGGLVASQSLVSCFPDIIRPGEKGYMYEETILNGFAGGELTVIPQVNAKPSQNPCVRYDVTDVSVFDDQLGGVKVMGRVENKTSEAGAVPYVAAVFYSPGGAPIGLAFTILTESFGAGEQRSFELLGFSLPPDVTADSISGTAMYAYPLQMQL